MYSIQNFSYFKRAMLTHCKDVKLSQLIATTIHLRKDIVNLMMCHADMRKVRKPSAATFHVNLKFPQIESVI